MKVLFRVDASADVGSGHLVRCLALAQELRRHGTTCRFVGRELPDHLAASVRGQGHELQSLGATAGGPAEAVWPLSAQLDDASAVCAIDSDGWDWLVVDHYGLGADWERAARPAARRLLAIDDLGRAHACDGLLDVNEQPEAQAQYCDLLERGTTCLLGPHYALLRPEFLAARNGLVPRDGPVRRVLVFMGGMDSVNATEPVLEAIALVDRTLDVDVVIGPSHPARARIEVLAREWPSLRCLIQNSDMAQLCVAADLAVGAGGGATWERCALGLPTLALSLAPNQRAVLERSARRGQVAAPAGLALDAQSIALHLRALIANPALRHHLSSNAMAAVDARGALRVASFMQYAGISVRPALADDNEALLAWRNQPEIRTASRDPKEISRADHDHWLASLLASTQRQLLIGELDDKPVGVVRFDTDGSTAEVSIYRVQSASTVGAGPGLLRAAEAWLREHRPDVRLLRAEVLRDNLPSHRLFLDAGYSRDSTRYLKEL
ncbi:MAG: UDP-2,4-diacetamido-2,4,6-trideoxy-beta-L-altropyranose hydrolase [Ramlibacter sp.]|nr:UDP-2,4-diacetamido-2,4,6-trideoxy-beta-L-altropyranose hydrolase [Ramlibacter sp.]